MLKDWKNIKALIMLIITIVVIAAGGWYIYQDILSKDSEPQTNVSPKDADDKTKQAKAPVNEIAVPNVENPVSGEQDYLQQLSEEIDELNIDPAAYLTSTGLQNLRDPFQSLFTPEQTTQSPAKDEPTESTTQNTPNNTPEQPKKEPEVVKEKDKTDVTYQDLLGSQKAPTEVTKEPEPVVVKPELQFPPFELKGMVSTGGIKKAILAMKSQSYIVSQGDQIQDWTMEEVNNAEVKAVNAKGQRFILTLEGVKVDETKI